MLIIHSLNLRYIFLARSEILAIFKGRYVFDKVRGGRPKPEKYINFYAGPCFVLARRRGTSCLISIIFKYLSRSYLSKFNSLQINVYRFVCIFGI